jgi:hypothetical protein
MMASGDAAPPSDRIPEPAREANLVLEVRARPAVVCCMNEAALSLGDTLVGSEVPDTLG